MPSSPAATCWACDVSTKAPVSEPEGLDEVHWRARQARHRERMEPWLAPRRDRRRRGQAHPVDDFLFDYYPYSLAKLAAWHPGYGVVLLGDAESFLEHPAYVRTDQGVAVDLDALASSRPRLRMVQRLLSRTSARSPQLGCFGLHEWAIAPRDIERVVDEVGLRCTHLDAYRFFTPTSMPLNAHVPTRAEQHEWEQPGCLHANMDLYFGVAGFLAEPRGVASAKRCSTPRVTLSSTFSSHPCKPPIGEVRAGLKSRHSPHEVPHEIREIGRVRELGGNLGGKVG